jgi:hypothetical protein
MMTSDEVRAAVESPNPAGGLDRLVRARLAAGKTTAEIYAALLPIARTIRTATPLPPRTWTKSCSARSTP